MAAKSKEASLYSSPMVIGPTLKELEDLSRGVNLGLEGIPELAEYQSVIVDSLKTVNLLDELVEPSLPVKYPRTPGYRPSREENPYNAWYYKSTIQGLSNGKLSGKRIAIKDCIAVAGIPMMIGCYALEGYVPDIDATVVTSVLDEGGTILGKATCEDLCYSGNSHTSAKGPVLNPTDTRHSAGGSSSGCAVLVATNEVDMAIGGDQGGSVRIPASWCGVVGLKPTFGLVPYTGAASGEFSLDYLGPITRTVQDCALLLEVIAGYDGGRDARQPCKMEVPNYSQHLEDLDLNKLRIGVLKEGFGQDCSDAAVDQLIKDSVHRFSVSIGASVEEVSIPLHAMSKAISIPILDIGGIDCVFTSGGAGIHNSGYYATSMMRDVGSRLKANMAKLAPAHKAMLLRGNYLKKNYPALYGKAQNLRHSLTKAFDDVLESVDVIAMPSIPFTASELPTKDASLTEILGHNSSMTPNLKAGNLTGHPTISINAGHLGRFPVGLLLTGKKFGELGLLQVAYAFEKFFKSK